MPITHAELQHHRAHGAVLGHADHVRRLGEHGAVVVGVQDTDKHLGERGARDMERQREVRKERES